MADSIDIANDLIDNEISRALSKIRQHTSQAPSVAAIKECLVCGDDIPDARKKLGFKLCVPCAQESERRKALFAEG